MNWYKVSKDGMHYTFQLSDEDVESGRYPGAKLVEPAKPKQTAAQKRAAKAAAAKTADAAKAGDEDKGADSASADDAAKDDAPADAGQDESTTGEGDD
ncbi:hypothetical protein SEA_DARDANUS_13 [Gordonia phage Dardanus]|uniref:Uncharacterized protein n=1 Tax=Gordonia phage Dardanus TaxID=2588489 RepID=A0A514CX23_9CAUD|nr:hypothetical protein KDJ58_gp13 [Gordonia phage Dardanus]QDH85050.1 hypothetical protein SEA_DARDANUS_13 [Gordonia phage Dardanus]